MEPSKNVLELSINLWSPLDISWDSLKKYGALQKILGTLQKVMEPSKNFLDSQKNCGAL